MVIFGALNKGLVQGLPVSEPEAPGERGPHPCAHLCLAKMRLCAGPIPGAHNTLDDGMKMRKDKEML